MSDAAICTRIIRNVPGNEKGAENPAPHIDCPNGRCLERAAEIDAGHLAFVVIDRHIGTVFSFQVASTQFPILHLAFLEGMAKADLIAALSLIMSIIEDGIN